MSSFSEGQLIALAVGPKIAGAFSLLGSGLILFKSTKALREKSAVEPAGSAEQRVYHRLLFGIAIALSVAAINTILGTWMTPEGTIVAAWASGNEKTCQAQAYLSQFGGLTTAFYYGSISIYYLLVIRWGWRNFQLRKVEWIMHVIPYLYGVGSATAGLLVDAYRVAGPWCWCYPAPGILSEQKSRMLRVVLLYGPLYLLIIMVLVNCLIVYFHVRRLELATAKYQAEHHRSAQLSVADNGPLDHPRAGVPRGQRMERTRAIAKQSFLYSGAFCVQWIPTTVRIYACVRSSGTPIFLTISSDCSHYSVYGECTTLLALTTRGRND